MSKTKKVNANNNAEVSLQEDEIYASLNIPERIEHLLEVYELINYFQHFFDFVRFKYPLATSKYFIKEYKDKKKTVAPININNFPIDYKGVKDFVEGLEIMKDYDHIRHNILDELVVYYNSLNDKEKFVFCLSNKNYILGGSTFLKYYQFNHYIDKLNTEANNGN